MADRQRNTRLVNHLKVHRAIHDLTQEQLAELVGVSRKTINKVERGWFVPSAELALKLARVLETTVEALFELPEDAERRRETEQSAAVALPPRRREA